MTYWLQFSVDGYVISDALPPVPIPDYAFEEIDNYHSTNLYKIEVTAKSLFDGPLHMRFVTEEIVMGWFRVNDYHTVVFPGDKLVFEKRTLNPVLPRFIPLSAPVVVPS